MGVNLSKKTMLLKKINVVQISYIILKEIYEF